MSTWRGAGPASNASTCVQITQPPASAWEQVKVKRSNIAAFWAKYRTRVEETWAEMSQDERLAWLDTTVAIIQGMPMNPTDPDRVLIIPEFTKSGLAEGTVLPDMIRGQATDDIIDLISDDLWLIRDLQAKGIISRRMQNSGWSDEVERSEFVVIGGSEDMAGKQFKITGKAQEKHFKEIQEFIAKGGYSTPREFEFIVARRLTMLTQLAIFCDEFRSQFKPSSANSDRVSYKTLRNGMCGFCGAVPEDKNKLKTCARCKSIFYCDQECQRSHWKEHKSECKLVEAQNNTA
ncbi:hypothetical protein M427DRAFT_157139 [Gonapodya prolifera JEL478]|uniref:MYND-type domain-containing protein n=1 Tax=Gonapodya prolifera (strain JEL478) TaxID=1344416 RepID=A0A139A7K4_GONPJ|nr:hypothetical protein M427DRAFT_157139 [Gonapodya prolifera JEL478]|eukprot:KXS12760.1 hypothetical protein M427DRAFT_157139 [Gonapodya prolifera JEL478]